MGCLLGNEGQLGDNALGTRLESHATLASEHLKPGTGRDITANGIVQMISITGQFAVNHGFIRATFGQQRCTGILNSGATGNDEVDAAVLTLSESSAMPVVNWVGEEAVSFF